MRGRHEIHVVAGVLSDEAGRVLVAQRPTGKHLAGRWEFPGGKLAEGEEPLIEGEGIEAGSDTGLAPAVAGLAGDDDDGLIDEDDELVVPLGDADFGDIDLDA